MGSEKRFPKVRYALWQIMLAVAALAVLFAQFGVTGALPIVIVVGATALPILLAGHGNRLMAAAMAGSLYPLLLPCSLYATWFTAWLVLGHRPRSSFDDPLSISPIVNILYLFTFIFVKTVPLSLFISIPLVIGYIVRRVRQRGMSLRGVAAWALLPVMLWASVLAILGLGLLGSDYVLMWYFD